MKKIITQDGIKGIFIYDDGTTAPISKDTKTIVDDKPKKKKKKEKKEEVIDDPINDYIE